MEEKYINLLLHRCTDLEHNKILFIHYNIEIQDFVEKISKTAKKLGIEEIYLDREDPVYIHDLLKNSTIQEIGESPVFDQSIWDFYAAKQASFLILETEYPHLMDDIEPEKIAASSKKRRESRPLYRKLVENCELSWCIAAYPGQKWAEEVFQGEEESYQKLKQAIFKICMIDQKEPIASWDIYLRKTKKIITYLNQLKLVKLHYANSLGTNLDVYLPKKYLFSNAEDKEVIVNMPSYEIFTSPDFRKTEGIVYSAKPLIYNGALIDNFWIKFSEGKVVDFSATTGEKVLQEIINTDANSCYLGECALVENNSPIANMNLTFGTTLIDENASCHLALGAGFPECLENGFQLTEEQLLAHGVNVSKNHVDFMIGTKDLEIVGTTESGEEIPIFTNGNFASHILEKCSN
ncbi:MAG: aminopeptidase [Erysipelotrichaceae bacterium]|nr:aminopeptidase [Erysipelotrichaceae bacterium]